MDLEDNAVGTRNTKISKNISNLPQQISGRARNKTFLSLQFTSAKLAVLLLHVLEDCHVDTDVYEVRFIFTLQLTSS